MVEKVKGKVEGGGEKRKGKEKRKEEGGKTEDRKKEGRKFLGVRTEAQKIFLLLGKKPMRIKVIFFLSSTFSALPRLFCSKYF